MSQELPELNTTAHQTMSQTMSQKTNQTTSKLAAAPALAAASDELTQARNDARNPVGASAERTASGSEPSSMAPMPNAATAPVSAAPAPVSATPEAAALAAAPAAGNPAPAAQDRGFLAEPEAEAEADRSQNAAVAAVAATKSAVSARTRASERLARAAQARALARAHEQERTQAFSAWYEHHTPTALQSELCSQRYELLARRYEPHAQLDAYLQTMAQAPAPTLTPPEATLSEVWPLKPELSAKLLDAFPPKAAQVTALSKALRSHPIALVPESLQAEACERRPEQQLSCDYQAYLLGKLKPQLRVTLFNQSLQNVFAPHGLSLERQVELDCCLARLAPQHLMLWARGDFSLPAYQAYYAQMAPDWTEDDLSAFECCDYELSAVPKAADVKRFTLALEQRRRCLEPNLKLVLSDLITLLSNLQPRATGLLLHKLQPLLRCDSLEFCRGLCALGRALPDNYPLVALLSLAPAADHAENEDTPNPAGAEPQPTAEAQRTQLQAATNDFLHSTETKLRGRLLKLAQRNDERAAQLQLAAAQAAAADTQAPEPSEPSPFEDYYEPDAPDAAAAPAPEDDDWDEADGASAAPDELAADELTEFDYELAAALGVPEVASWDDAAAEAAVTVPAAPSTAPETIAPAVALSTNVDKDAAGSEVDQVRVPNTETAAVPEADSWDDVAAELAVTATAAPSASPETTAPDIALSTNVDNDVADSEVDQVRVPNAETAAGPKAASWDNAEAAVTVPAEPSVAPETIAPDVALSTNVDKDAAGSEVDQVRVPNAETAAGPEAASWDNAEPTGTVPAAPSAAPETTVPAVALSTNVDKDVADSEVDQVREPTTAPITAPSTDPDARSLADLSADAAARQRFAQLGLELIAPVAINWPEAPCVYQTAPELSEDCHLIRAQDQPELWVATVPQCYGIQRCHGTFELINPIWTNMLDCANWFGGRVATRPYTYILPQAITACDEQGVPRAQFVSSMADGYTPRVEYLLHETIAAENLKSYFLDPDYLEQVRADFAQSWLNTNNGAGFELCPDPTDPAYLGYEGEAAARSIHYHGSVEECTMSAYPPVYLDRLHLEQLYLSSISPTAAHPYGQAVEVMYPQFLNALRWIQAQAAQASGEEFKQLNAVATQLSDLLCDAAMRAHWWADRCLNFEVSCTIVNQSSERKVIPNVHYCNWVANQVQYDLLMEARKSEAQLKRDIRDLTALVTAHNLPLIDIYVSAQSPVGALYAAAAHQQLAQGLTAFDYHGLPQLPQGLLPPQLRPEDNAVFLLNRAQQRLSGCILSIKQIKDLDTGLRAPIEARTKIEWCNLQFLTAPALYDQPNPVGRATPPHLEPNAAFIQEGATWTGYATQLYGERTNEVQVELIRPVLTNQIDPQCWYGGRTGPDQDIFIRPEAIGTVDETGIPQVLISHDDSLELNPVVEQLLCIAEPRSALKYYTVTPEAAQRRHQIFVSEWQNTNDGQGFSVTTDASTPEYCGRDRYDTTSEEEWARYAMVMSQAELKADNALRQQHPCDLEELTQAHADPLEYDQLLLEQIITANCRPDAAHPHGLVATLMFPQYDNALHYGKMRCLMLPAGRERQALKVQLKRLEDALHEASDSAIWMADRILNFEASCDLTNSGLSPRPVERDLHRCSWVYNRAQYWCLIDARRGEVNVKRDLALLRQLTQDLPVATMRLTRTSALGLKYDLCRHQQLLAGKCAFDFKDLPPLPAGMLPPLMSPEDNARFVLNRRRYQALKLGATGVETMNEAELLRFMQQANAPRAERIAAARAQGQNSAHVGVGAKVKGLLGKLLRRR